jgi:hypothetical protein
MRSEVARALAEHAPERRARLQALTRDQRRLLLEELISDFFVDQRQVLLKWSALTGQSAQIDTGYIAQHIASVTLGEPGQGFKGKGVDLADGGEVKSAALLSGVDRPRWNHDMGTLASDEDRSKRGLDPKWKTYLEAPRIFYVLFDRAATADGKLRVRAWCVDPKRDDGWRDLFERFVQERSPSRYNLQLHPPIGRDDSLVVNTLGNLDFEELKVFEAVFGLPERSEDFAVEWVVAPNDDYQSRVSTAYPYKRSRERRIEIEGADGHVLLGEDDVRRLFKTFD